MTTLQVYDVAGQGFDFTPDGGVFDPGVTETLVSETYLGNGYYTAETNVQGSEIANSSFYLYFINNFGELVYERIEGYLNGSLSLSISNTATTELSLAQLGIEAFFQGDDKIIGNNFSDRIYGFSGDDLIDGQGGNDTAAYFGSQNSYTLQLSATSDTIDDRRLQGDGTDTLVDIEKLDFNSGSFDLTQFGGTTVLSGQDFESFIELYIAYFNRAPDAIGLNFWGTAYANGTSLQEMATLFADQEETLGTYPTGTTNLQFATTVYNNVLGRTPDQSGLDFWVGQLDSGSVTKDQFILEVLGGVQAGSTDRSYLDDKVDIGAYFAVHKGMSDVENASTAMALFNGTDASIDTAVTAVDNYYADALDPNNGEFLMQVVGVLDDPFAGI